jgi:hypothetical protein
MLNGLLEVSVILLKIFLWCIYSIYLLHFIWLWSGATSPASQNFEWDLVLPLYYTYPFACQNIWSWIEMWHSPWGLNHNFCTTLAQSLLSLIVL